MEIVINIDKIKNKKKYKKLIETLKLKSEQILKEINSKNNIRVYNKEAKKIVYIKPKTYNKNKNKYDKDVEKYVKKIEIYKKTTKITKITKTNKQINIFLHDKQMIQEHIKKANENFYEILKLNLILNKTDINESPIDEIKKENEKKVLELYDNEDFDDKEINKNNIFYNFIENNINKNKKYVFNSIINSLNKLLFLKIEDYDNGLDSVSKILDKKYYKFYNAGNLFSNIYENFVGVLCSFNNEKTINEFIKHVKQERGNGKNYYFSDDRLELAAKIAKEIIKYKKEKNENVEIFGFFTPNSIFKNLNLHSEANPLYTKSTDIVFILKDKNTSKLFKLECSLKSKENDIFYNPTVNIISYPNRPLNNYIYKTQNEILIKNLKNKIQLDNSLVFKYQDDFNNVKQFLLKKYNKNKEILNKLEKINNIEELLNLDFINDDDFVENVINYFDNKNYKGVLKNDMSKIINEEYNINRFTESIIKYLSSLTKEELNYLINNAKKILLEQSPLLDLITNKIILVSSNGVITNKDIAKYCDYNGPLNNINLKLTTTKKYTGKISVNIGIFKNLKDLNNLEELKEILKIVIRTEKSSKAIRKRPRLSVIFAKKFLKFLDNLNKELKNNIKENLTLFKLYKIL